jgi:outer membrane protein OmpA-like peptidoglycan-associated protein
MKKILLIAVFTLPAYGAEPPEPSQDDPHIRYVEYDKDDVTVIHVRRGIVTRITLAPQEKIIEDGSARGFPSDCSEPGLEWCVRADPGTNLVLVEPTRGAMRKKIELRTNLRDYSLALHVVPDANKSRHPSQPAAAATTTLPMSRVIFTYPPDSLATGAAFAPLAAVTRASTAPTIQNGTPPKLALPHGRSRVPINSQGAIDDYIAAAALETATAAEEAQQRRMDALKRDRAELKVETAELSLHQEELPAAARDPVPVRATKARPGSAGATASRAEYLPSEKITIRARSILFTITLGVGETQFSPSIAFQQALLKAAKNATSIEILGATDATKANAGSARTAKASAENARKYLLDKGIELGRMTTTYLAARGFVADNATSEGKARNRRVGIEMMIPDTAALEAKF